MSMKAVIDNWRIAPTSLTDNAKYAEILKALLGFVENPQKKKYYPPKNSISLHGVSLASHRRIHTSPLKKLEKVEGSEDGDTRLRVKTRSGNEYGLRWSQKDHQMDMAITEMTHNGSINRWLPTAKR